VPRPNSDEHISVQKVVSLGNSGRADTALVLSADRVGCGRRQNACSWEEWVPFSEPEAARSGTEILGVFALRLDTPFSYSAGDVHHTVTRTGASCTSIR
jgi:hypothetical protein